MGEGLHGLEVAVPTVADHTAEEAVVGPAHEDAGGVAHLSEGFDVEAEFFGGGDAVGHAFVEAVEAVDEEDLMGFDGEFVDVEFAFSGFEVVVGGLDGFAFEEVEEVLVDEFEVEGLRGFVVVVAEFILGMHFEVEEVVVDVDGDEFVAVGAEGFAEFDGGGGFSGGGGSGDDGDADFGEAFDDAFGAAFDFVGVALFAVFDEVGESSGADDGVEAVDGFALVVHVPAEDFVDFFVGDVVGGFEVVEAGGALLGAFVAVDDVGAGGFDVSVFDEGGLDEVLDVFYGGDVSGGEGFEEGVFDLEGEIFGDGAIGASDGGGSLEDGGGDAVAVIGNGVPVAFYNFTDGARGIAHDFFSGFSHRFPGSLRVCGGVWGGASCGGLWPQFAGCVHG